MRFTLKRDSRYERTFCWEERLAGISCADQLVTSSLSVPRSRLDAQTPESFRRLNRANEMFLFASSVSELNTVLDELLISGQMRIANKKSEPFFTYDSFPH